MIMNESKLEIIDEYFENGIKIKVLKGFTEIKPRNVNLEYPDRIKDSVKYANNYYNQKLRDWCSSRQGRMKEITENSPMSLSWFSQRRYGSRILHRHDYEKIVQPAMKKVEQNEALRFC